VTSVLNVLQSAAYVYRIDIQCSIVSMDKVDRHSFRKCKSVNISL